jgi:hypothetical protein
MTEIGMVVPVVVPSDAEEGFDTANPVLDGDLDGARVAAPKVDVGGAPSFSRIKVLALLPVSALLEAEAGFMAADGCETVEC